VRGVDKQGSFEGLRRYNEFFMLHQALCQRWPGMYVPKIPPKQTIGNKDMKFIIERRYYLERFLRKIAKQEFLLNSEEFALFSRPSGDIEKMLQKISRLPTMTIVERIRQVTSINEKRYDMVDKERYRNNLIEFGFFFKKVTTQMKALKDLIETSRVTKRISITHSKAFMHLIDKYEELNMRCYVDNNYNRLVFWKESNKELKVQMDHLVDNLKNPFDEMYNWCKGELYDLSALDDAVKARDNLEANLKKLE
jgi:hypothetical protein